MSAFLAAMRDGRWLTRERIRLWALAVLAASVLGTAFLLATSDGLNDYQGRPLGTDFSNVYAAGTYVLDGQAAAPFDWPAQHAREQMIFGEKTPFYGWHYPPYFLFIAGLLALMPFTLALAAWQGVTLALYLGSVWWILHSTLAPITSPRLRGEVGSRSDPGEGDSQRSRRNESPPHPDPLPGIRAFTPVFDGLCGEREPTAVGARTTVRLNQILEGRLWLLLALAFPAVFVNIGHGHNGFLTAALIGTALLTLDRKPVVSGILFGLMAYKPQFGVLIPMVLAASGRWRVFLAAAATVVALTLATMLAFGPDAWRAFFASMHLTRVEVLEQGGTGWHKIQSVFSIVRMWGGGVPLAYVTQGTTMIAIAAALVWLWRSNAAYPLKAAALIVASILATPYSLDYDFVILAPALAFLAADGMTRGFAPWEKTALAFLWFMPLIARTVAENVLIPLGVPAMLLVFVLVLRRAAADTGVTAGWDSAAQPTK